MKQLHLFVAVATLFFNAVLAQPTVTRANVNTTTFTSEFLYAPADGFDPGEAGANQTWDFSSLNLMTIGTDTTLPVAATPHAATFPTANYCYKYQGIFGGGDLYYYHQITDQKYDILSIAWNGASGDNYNPDPRTFMVFPYAYNDTYTDTYVSTDDNIVKNVTASYDAYGTVIMPYGTFTDVIRQKIVTNGVTDYIWFNVEPFYPIVQTVLAENGLGIVRNTTVLGIEDAKAGQFSVSPNPTTGNVMLHLEQPLQNAEVSVFNALGQCVLRQKTTGGDSISLDLSQQPSGVYMVNLTDTDQRVSHTQKIIKQ